MITNADLSSYGSVIEAVEEYVDSLPVDCSIQSIEDAMKEQNHS